MPLLRMLFTDVVASRATKRDASHDAHSNPDDGLEGPVFGLNNRSNEAAIAGRACGPALVERWTKVTNGELNLYYAISAWNPCAVVLMKSRLALK
jgi:hypothetical protein